VASLGPERATDWLAPGSCLGGYMSLADVYRNAWDEKFGLGSGWAVAWPGPAVSIGQRGVMSGREFVYRGHASDYGVTFDFDPAPPKDGGPWDYSSSSDVAAEIGIDATAPGWGWLGSASAGLSVGFGEQESIYLSADSTIIERVANVDKLKADLLTTAVQQGMPDGQSIVIERQLSRKAVLVASEGGTGDLKAKVGGKVNVTPGAKGAVASLAGHLNFHSKTGSTFMQNFPDEFVLAYRVVTLGTRGWWLWRHIGVRGFLPVSAGIAETFLTPDDYFATFS
jgi:hypothetical protein